MVGDSELLIVPLREKGFIPLEVPGLINDVVQIVREGSHRSIDAMNQELEDLGWGISALDNITYDRIIAFIHNETVIG